MRGLRWRSCPFRLLLRSLNYLPMLTGVRAPTHIRVPAPSPAPDSESGECMGAWVRSLQLHNTQVSAVASAYGSPTLPCMWFSAPHSCSVYDHLAHCACLPHPGQVHQLAREGARRVHPACSTYAGLRQNVQLPQHSTTLASCVGDNQVVVDYHEDQGAVHAPACALTCNASASVSSSASTNTNISTCVS